MAAASVRSSTKNGASTGATTWTVSKPLGAAVGDWVLIYFVTTATSGTPAVTSNTFTTTSGPDAMTGGQQMVWMRKIDGTEGASFSGTLPLSGYGVIAICIQGADGTTPLDVAIATTNSASNTSFPVAPSLTPAGGRTDDLFITLWGSGQGSATWTPPTTTPVTTEESDLGVTGAPSMCVNSQVPGTSSATGTRTGHASTNLNGTRTYSLLIRAAVVARPKSFGGVGGMSVPPGTVATAGVGVVG